MYVRNRGALILQLYIRHAGDAGTERAQFAKLLSYVAILPWVRVPHLASHILSRVTRRLSHDWQDKYGHPIDLLETFVERDRFAGTAYRAAGWIAVGATTGRGRNGPGRAPHGPLKAVYLQPLSADFRRRLGA